MNVASSREGFSAIWDSNNNGTVAYVVAGSHSGKGWLHGHYIANAVQSGFTVLGGTTRPAYGGIITAAQQAALVIGPRRVLSGTVGANTQDRATTHTRPPLALFTT